MPSLVIISGESKDRHLPLLHPITSLGRDDTCTFQILDDQVSRKHLQIRLDPKTGQHIAGDYRSANGVFINGKQVTLDTPLTDGDHIRLGRTTLVYLVGDHPDDESAIAAARHKGEWKRSTIMRRD